MFDIGFWELTVVGLVSLLVIGPERLPRVARLTGFWIGKARHMAASVRREIREELYAEDLRQTLARNAPDKALNSLVEETRAVAHSVADAAEEISRPRPGGAETEVDAGSKRSDDE